MSPERDRDLLGRPLPPGADPGLIVASVPQGQAFTDDQAWTEAVAYLDRGMPFHAHEVFELRWRQSPAERRDAWKALAQWGAALTHQARGNALGARRVAARARILLTASDVPECVDMPRVLASLGELESTADPDAH
jgi:hypothetical protein